MSERFAFGYGSPRPARASDSSMPPAGPVPGPVAVTGRADGAPERRDFAFLGLLAFTALLYVRPQDHITPLRVLPLAEITAVGALLAMVFGRLSKGLTVTRQTPELVGVALFGMLMLATAPFSIWPGGAIGTFTGLYVKVLLIFLLLVNTLTSRKRVEQFTWLIVGASGYIGFRAVFDYARGVNLVENGRVTGAVGGMFQNPNDLALNMVVVLPLAVFLTLQPGTMVRRLAGLGCALAMTGAIVASHSRSGTVGLGVMGIFLAIHLARKRPGLVGAGVFVLVLSMPLMPGSYWERVSSITDESRDETGSREARRLLLGEAWAAFLSNPLTGVGAGQFRNYNPEGRAEPWRETHNVLLQVAAEMGVAGVMVFMFLIYRAASAGRATRRLLRRLTGEGRAGRRIQTSERLSPELAEFLRSYAGITTAALTGWFFCALFASVAYHWTFYYLLALAAAPRQILADRLAATTTAAHRAATPAHLREVRA